jgi:hypothetical protein
LLRDPKSGTAGLRARPGTGVAAVNSGPKKIHRGIGKMIRIRYANGNAVDLEGSNRELSDLRDSIHEFADSIVASIRFEADADFDPSPYESTLECFRVSKSNDRLTFSVCERQLLLEGKPEFLRLFADNLPYGCEQVSEIRYHHHFERGGRETHVSEKSLDMVLSLRE